MDTTIGNLLTQDDQVRCFQNAARHLTGGGFVPECLSRPRRPGHQFVAAERIEAGRIVLDVCRYDPVTRLLDESHMHISVYWVPPDAGW